MFILFDKFSRGLRLFKGVRLFQTLEYATRYTSCIYLELPTTYLHIQNGILIFFLANHDLSVHLSIHIDFYQLREPSSKYIEFLFHHHLFRRWGGRGAFTNYVYKIWLFWPPNPLRLHFLWYKSLQKVDFLDHLPPSSCKRSLWTPP